MLRPYADGHGAASAKIERTHPEKAIVARAHRRGPRARGSTCCSTSASAISRSSAARRRCRPASCSACGSRRRCARTCSASSTCSTSRRRGCIRPTPRRCSRALDRLKASGNSLFVVEHELDVIRHADWIVDVGPAAGEHGGEILYSGPPDGLRDVEAVADARATCSRDDHAADARRRASRAAGCGSKASRATTCTISTSSFRSAC